jgi:hypothetical protein
MPIEPRMRAETVGKVVRVRHDCSPG